MKKKKFSKKYIEDIEKRISKILNDESECSDWTQICFSMKDAVLSAATIWGNNTDNEKHLLVGFIQEMVVQEIDNINKFDITVKKKGENHE